MQLSSAAAGIARSMNMERMLELLIGVMFLVVALRARTFYFGLFRKPLSPAPYWPSRVIFLAAAAYLLWLGLRGGG